MNYLFRQALSCRSVPDCPSYCLKDASGSGLCLAQNLSSTALQLKRNVFQDAHLNGGQRCLQVGRAHVTLRQPLDQRLRDLTLLLVR